MNADYTIGAEIVWRTLKNKRSWDTYFVTGGGEVFAQPPHPIPPGTKVIYHNSFHDTIQITTVIDYEQFKEETWIYRITLTHVPTPTSERPELLIKSP